MSSGQGRIYGGGNPNTDDVFREPYYEYKSPYPYDRNQYPVDPYHQPVPTSEPYVQKSVEHVGDFTPFYIAVTICAIIGFSLFILNVALGCCSRYSEYWNDRHTGNRWLVSLWTATPHRQPPADPLTELQEISSHNQVVYHHPQQEESERTEFLELKTKRESEI